MWQEYLRQSYKIVYELINTKIKNAISRQIYIRNIKILSFDKNEKTIIKLYLCIKFTIFTEI